MQTETIRRSLATAAAGVAVAAVMAATADAATVGDGAFRIAGGVADFGSGNHSVGNPEEKASDTDDISVVNGQMVVSKRIRGTLYWDSLDPGCARVTIRFRNRLNQTLATRTRSVCGSGGNANDADNKRAIDESFAGPALDNAIVETRQDQNGALSGGGQQTLLIRLLRRWGLRVGSGTADFGDGAHVGGWPFDHGEVEFQRDPTELSVSVQGRLYWDAAFSSGCARIVVDYRDAAGNILNTQSATECGPGGNANDDANNRTISLGWSDPALFRTRTRVGSVVNGNFVGVTTRNQTFGV
jgi:hypothetical protein